MGKTRGMAAGRKLKLHRAMKKRADKQLWRFGNQWNKHPTVSRFRTGDSRKPSKVKYVKTKIMLLKTISGVLTEVEAPVSWPLSLFEKKKQKLRSYNSSI